MWSIRELYQSKRGFTLVELVLGICIVSIILTISYSILGFSSLATSIGEELDEIQYNGRYGIEYLKSEIQNADKIISSHKIKDLDSKFPQNIGFVIMMYDTSESSNCLFISYYLKGNKLTRVSRWEPNSKYPNADRLTGVNDICEYVLSIDKTEIEWNNNILSLNITMGNENKSEEYKSTIYLNCTLDY